MKVIFSKQAAADYRYWQKHDRRVLLKIQALLHDIDAHPFTGIGKPEPLKHDLAGCWSRRITQEHRLVYLVDDGQITVVQCRFHY